MLGKGFQVLSADGVVNTSGTPIILYAVNIVNSGSANAVNFRNGTTSSDTSVLRLNVPASGIGSQFDFGGVGMLFPNGCFVDFDANTTQVTVVYERLV